MKNFEEVNKLVVAKLDWFNRRGQCPTARELYVEMRKEANDLDVTFRSFAKLITRFESVEKIPRQTGAARAVYKLAFSSL